MILPNFPKKCKKLRKFWSVWGACRGTPLDLPQGKSPYRFLFLLPLPLPPPDHHTGTATLGQAGKRVVGLIGLYMLFNRVFSKINFFLPNHGVFFLKNWPNY